jgi:TP901 family phage tail tape measure protein
MSSLGSLMVIIGANTAGLTAAQHDLRRLQTAMTHTQSAFKTLEQGMVTFGRTLTQYVTLPVTLLGIAAVKTFADFEYELAKIEGLVGISGATVQEWGNQILEMASSFGKAPQELAEALYFVTSSGFKSAEAMEVMKTSAMAASAGLGETKDIANIVTSAINAYGKANITAAQAADVLTVAVREGKGEPAELVKAFATVIPVAAKLGVHFDQVGGAIAAMTRYGIPAANASTYLRQTLFTLLKPTNQVKKGLAQFGLTAQDVRNSLRSDGLIDTLQMLQEKIGTNEEALGQIFPNIRAFMGVTSLLGANLEETIGVFNDTKNSLGATAAAFEIISQTTKFKFNAAMAEAKATLIKFGEAIMEMLLPTIVNITRKIRDLGNWFTGLSKPTQELIIKVLGFTAAVGPLLLILNLLITVTIRPLILLLTTLRNVIRTVIIQMGLMTKAGSLLTTVINLQKIAYLAWAYQIAYVTGNKTKLVAITKVLNKVIAATPWGWVALAIGAVVTVLALLIKKKKELTDVEKISNEISTEVNNSVAKEVAHLDRLKRVLDNNTSSEEQRAVAIRELNKTMSIYTGGIIVEKEEIEKLIKVSKDEKRTKTEREEALQEATRLQEIYNKGITEEKVRTGQAADMINTYMGMLKKKYKLQAAEQLIVKKMAEQLELQDKIAQGEGLSDKEKAEVIIPRSLAATALLGPATIIYELFKQADWLAEATQKKVTTLETSVSWLQETITSLNDQVFGIEEIQIIGVAPPDIIPDDLETDLERLKRLQGELAKVFEDFNIQMYVQNKESEKTGDSYQTIIDQANLLNTTIKKLRELEGQDMFSIKTKSLETVYDTIKDVAAGAELFKETMKDVGEENSKTWAQLDYDIRNYKSTTEQVLKLQQDFSKDLATTDIYANNLGKSFDKTAAQIEFTIEYIKELKEQMKNLAPGETSVEGMGSLVNWESFLETLNIKKASEEFQYELDDIQTKANLLGGIADTNGLKISMFTKYLRGLSNVDIGKIIESGDIEALKKWIEGIRVGTEELKKMEAAREVANLIQNSFTSLFTTIGEGLGKVFAGEEDAMSNLFKGILSVMFDFAKQFGEIMIGLGMARIALDAIGWTGVGAVVAGMALVTLASAAQSLLDKGPDLEKAPGMAMGGVVPAGYPRDTYPALLSSGEMVVPPHKLPEFENREMEVKVVVEGVTKGSDLYYVMKEVSRRYKNSF